MTDDGLLQHAAAVAFSMMRFESGAANEALFQSRDGPQFGVDHFVFLPVQRPVARDRVVEHLLALPSRAVLIPSSIRGFIAEVLLSELVGERLRAAERVFVQADEAIEYAVKQFGIAEDTAILVEVDATPIVVPFAALRAAFARWAVHGVAGNIDPIDTPDIAAFRLSLIRSDGTFSPGSACGLQPAPVAPSV
jgi:hypothetical protein